MPVDNEFFASLSDAEAARLAKSVYGYKGPYAASVLQGIRDASGNLRTLDQFKGGDVGLSQGELLNAARGMGIGGNAGMLRYGDLSSDPEANALMGEWGRYQDSQRGFSMEPWMVAAMPFAVGGLQGAGVLGTEAAAGAAEVAAPAAGTGGTAAGEYGLGTVGSGTGIGGGSAGLGYGGAGGVQTVGGIGSVASGGAAAGSGMGAAGLGATFSMADLPGILQSIPKEIWSAGIQGVLGYLGADAKGDALKDVSNQQFGIGAPYRDLLLKSYGKDFDLMNQPGYGDAFDRMADISTRSWSAKGGNPANNPGIQGSILNDVWSQGYLPALSNYRGQLGQFGGMGLNTSAAASLAGADFSNPWLTGLGTAAGGYFGSQKPEEQKKDPMKLTVGGNIWGS